MKPAAASLVLALFAAFHLSAPARGETAAERHFVEFVKPLLDSRCVSCHGSDKVKGGLRLDSREAVLKAGDSGSPAVVPGRPHDSLLLQAVMHSRKDLEMPPKDRLTSNDVAILERWIQNGAPWPSAAASAAGPDRPALGERLGDAWTDRRNPIVRLFGGQRLEVWSLRPMQLPAVPAVRNRRWVQTPIDSFVLHRLESRGQSPARHADKRVLARRLYFDLSGLPPTPAQMEAFLADTRPNAVARLVDELLEAPAYAEHWARLWLDVVRYSDSNGFDWDEFRPNAWRFRDYVIRSFRADKPFHRFIREQLAGDELFEGAPRSADEQDALIATGYLRLGPQDNSAGAFNEQDRARSELMADLTETTASAFLGLTLACCRCHDHKFDPFSQADHFRFRAFFEPVKYADDAPIDLAADQDSIRAHNASIEKQVSPLQRQRDELLGSTKSRLRAERLAKLTSEEQALIALPADRQTNGIKASVESLERKITPSEKETKGALTGEDKTRHAGLEKEIAVLNARRRRFTPGLLMTDAAGPVPVTHVLFQGDHKAKKEAVEPGFLSILDPNPAVVRPSANRQTTGRRLTLAEWIASPEHPLTARVFVNRVWQAYFGRGLVETPNDFGLAGARPTDPQLLDWLAHRFIAGGWSVKELHRVIVLSATYQQAASHDTADLAATGYSHPPRRLSAEQLRDNLLAVSGLLVPRAGGPPVWPDLPPEILQANPAFLDDNETKTKGWYPSPKADQFVRSIYLVQKKTVRVPFMETFDLPENSVSCARRGSSTVPPQAMALLNSALAVAAAKTLAARVEREAGREILSQVERAFQLALQRAPSPGERETCRRFVAEQGLTAFCRSVLNLNEFVYVD